MEARRVANREESSGESGFAVFFSGIET